MRLVIELRKDYNDPTLRTSVCYKGNYIPETDKRNSYVLNFHENMV